MRKTLKGMTLIEVMIVIAIVALLLILTYVVYITQIAKARDAKRKSDIYELKTAVENYEKDKECYPAYIPGCGLDSGWPYLERIPCQPGSHLGYFYYPEPDPNNCPSWYWIFADLENDNDPVIDDLGCANGCGPTVDVFFNYYQTSPNAPEPIKLEEPAPSGLGCKYGILWGCFDGMCKPIYVCDGNILQCGPNYNTDQCGWPCGDGTDPGHTCCVNDLGQPQNECVDGEKT